MVNAPVCKTGTHRVNTAGRMASGGRQFCADRSGAETQSCPADLKYFEKYGSVV